MLDPDNVVFLVPFVRLAAQMHPITAFSRDKKDRANVGEDMRAHKCSNFGGHQGFHWSTGFAPLLRLQVRQAPVRFSSLVGPPFDHGFTWSASYEFGPPESLVIS